ncbi:hypothetical protein EsH8_VIII_000805 [Colletotrichum jinshuiense]
MSAMSRNNSVGAIQGFSISQPFLGASLQFYPALGTQELDSLIAAYVPGSASIQEKRATVSMDFFEYSQLTGEAFKYYSIAQSFSSTASSTESSPNQDSGYNSNFVSPVISDWGWSQSTSSSASVSTPASVSQETMPSKAPKKVASSAVKSQASDFSHLPGMKIMTKDGRDVTNSASRGCKTKEQRDHAHLMRIIKACDACKKKKVRCDPSHKKRAATQSQTATPVRLAKKVKTSAKDSRAITERPSQQNASSSTPSFFVEPSFAGLEIPGISVDLSESWESFVQFDDEPINVAPFDYDFFFDPEGHLSPDSSQSPATPSRVLAQPQGGVDRMQNLSAGKPSHNELVVRPPTLPYLDATADTANYIDFNLYSPEPSFLDDDIALLTDISSSTSRDHRTRSQHRSLAQGRHSPSSEQLDRDRSPLLPNDTLAVDYGAFSAGYLLEESRVVDRGRRSLSRQGAQATGSPLSGGIDNAQCFTGAPSVSLQIESVSQPSNPTSFSSTQTVGSQPMVDRTQQPSLPQGQPPRATPFAGDIVGVSSTSRSGLPRRVIASTVIASGLAGNEGTSRVPVAMVTSSSCFSTSLKELSCYAQTAISTTGASNCGVSDTSMNVYLPGATIRSSESHGTAAPLSSRSSVTEVFRLSAVQSVTAMVAGDSFSSKRRSPIESSKSQLLACMLLCMAVFGMLAASFETQALVGGCFQIAFGLAIFKAYHSGSSLYDSKPQQSRLSTTLKPQGFSDSARLLSCISTRLRHTRRQNQNVHCRVRPAWTLRVLGLA